VRIWEVFSAVRHSLQSIMDSVSSRTRNIAAQNTSAGACGENEKSRSRNVEDHEKSREKFGSTRTARSTSENERIDTIRTASSPSSGRGGTTPVPNSESENPSQSDQSRHGDQEPVNKTEPPTANQPSEQSKSQGPSDPIADHGQTSKRPTSLNLFGESRAGRSGCRT
jgi:hypothetical protein